MIERPGAKSIEFPFHLWIFIAFPLRFSDTVYFSSGLNLYAGLTFHKAFLLRLALLRRNTSCNGPSILQLFFEYFYQSKGILAEILAAEILAEVINSLLKRFCFDENPFRNIETVCNLNFAVSADLQHESIALTSKQT